MEVMYQLNVRYIKIWPQSESYITGSSSSLYSDIATNISYPVYIYFKPQFSTQILRNILSNVLDQSFHIAARFLYRNFDLSCLSCHL